MKILVASDKWKGSLSAPAACAAMRLGLRHLWPDAAIIERPIADGGEGTAEAVAGACHGRWIRRTVTGPLGGCVDAAYVLLPDGTAVIEMAAAAGLVLTGGRLDPWQATTRGVGELMADAAQQGARRIIVGLGGSATNDGGAGMAQALGAGLLDSEGHALAHGGAALALLPLLLVLLGDLDRRRRGAGQAVL